MRTGKLTHKHTQLFTSHNSLQHEKHPASTPASYTSSFTYFNYLHLQTCSKLNSLELSMKKFWETKYIQVRKGQETENTKNHSLRPKRDKRRNLYVIPSHIMSPSPTRTHQRRPLPQNRKNKHKETKPPNNLSSCQKKNLSFCVFSLIHRRPT